ncbi:MAG: 3-keto-disaccharide hydrolase, partial [Thermoanaerobaculia bacterium]
EVFYRKVEIRPLSEVPREYLAEVPAGAVGEEGFTPLFGKDAADGWAQCGPGSFVLEDGIATGRAGMGLWWCTRKQYGDFVLRGEFLQEEELADSGVFLRFPDPRGDPWNAVKQGHEVEIGDSRPARSKDGTGSIYPFHGPVEVPVRPIGQWNEYEIACEGQHYSVRLNGRLVNTWTDPARRARKGFVGLQNYNDGKTVRHRNLRVKELP